jgi:hypothetical protein
MIMIATEKPLRPLLRLAAASGSFCLCFFCLLGLFPSVNSANVYSSLHDALVKIIAATASAAAASEIMIILAA